MLKTARWIPCLLALAVLTAGPLIPALAGGAPAGFIEICSAFGSKFVAADSIPGEHTPDEGAKKHCPFCTVRTMAAIPPATVPLSLPADQVDAPVPQVLSFFFRHDFDPHAARGPPALI